MVSGNWLMEILAFADNAVIVGQASGVNSVVFDTGRCFVVVRFTISHCMSFSICLLHECR